MLGTAALLVLDEEFSDTEIALKPHAQCSWIGKLVGNHSTMPALQNSHQWDDTESILAVLWNEPICPTLVGPVDLRKGKRCRKSICLEEGV